MKKWILYGLVSMIHSWQAQCESISASMLSTATVTATEPRLAGSLIAPMGTVVPYRDVVVRSYLYLTTHTGDYNQRGRVCSDEENFYSLKAQFQYFVGLNSWCDLNVVPQFLLNTTSNQYYFNAGDLTVGLDFQLMPDDFTSYFPGVKLAIREVLPTGNFQRFSPRKLFADETGFGTFATQFNLVLYKLFHLRALYWASATVSAQYTLNTPRDVHGFNAYGGGFGTKGKVIPGNGFQGIISFELTLNKNWAVALDNIYQYINATEFIGIPGISFYGTFADIGSPFSEQFSFAPALEYHWSQSIRLIAGSWLSAWGRNSTKFRSGVVDFEYVY